MYPNTNNNEKSILLLPPAAYNSINLNSERNANSQIKNKNFRGPLSPRKCSDFSAIFVFFLLWLFLLALGFFSFFFVPNRIGTTNSHFDYSGKKCDDFLYFPSPEKAPLLRLCVKKCVSHKKNVTFPVQTIEKANGNSFLTFSAYDSQPDAHKICQPIDSPKLKNIQNGQTDFLAHFFASLAQNWLVLLATSASALVLALLYFAALFACGGGICFSFAVVLIEAALVGGTYFFYHLSSTYTESKLHPVANRKSEYTITAIALAVCSVFFFFTNILMIKRYILACDFLGFARTVLRQMKQLVAVPLCFFFIFLLIFIWTSICLHSFFTAGQEIRVLQPIQSLNPTAVVVPIIEIEPYVALRWCSLILLVCVYWTVIFLHSCIESIIAQAVAIWYFSPNQQSQQSPKLKLLDSDQPVSYSVKCMLFYHSGTLLKTAVFVNIVEFFRRFFMWLHHHATFKNPEANATTITANHQQPKTAKKPNQCAKFLQTCCCCCIWCVESWLKYVCKEAMYITAIQGTNFSISSKVAYELINSNLLRVGSVRRIGNAAAFLGKIVVGITTVFIAWILLDTDNSMSSPWMPLLFSLFFSYTVAFSFMTIYETSINVLLMCFLLDENLHGGLDKAVFAEQYFVDAIDEHLRPKWQTVL